MQRLVPEIASRVLIQNPEGVQPPMGGPLPSAGALSSLASGGHARSGPRAAMPRTCEISTTDFLKWYSRPGSNGGPPDPQSGIHSDHKGSVSITLTKLS